MSYYYTDDEGKFLVKLARKTIETYLLEKKKIKPPEDTPEKLKQNSGVFVTINKLVGEKKKREHELRGCIGFPMPIKPLVEATIDAAIEAAFHDPRFSPLDADELDDIVVEVSILTPPKKLEVSDPREYPLKIKIVRDGLIIRYGFYSGLLLPQVPVEYNWNVEEFLSYTCLKAGLPPDSWLDEDVKIYKFQAIIFEEEKPYGSIKQKILEGK